jgi:DNA-binding transcriptional MerR regulator
MTVGDAARQLGVTTRQVRYVCDFHDVPEPRRVGAYRVFLPEDLPALREALVKRGYLREEPADVA